MLLAQYCLHAVGRPKMPGGMVGMDQKGSYVGDEAQSKTCDYACQHSDVLNEVPTSVEGKLRLLDEVKNRAKGAFQRKDMPSAEALYGKAIELLDTMPGKQEAVLYSNRAMVRLNLGKCEDALFDAKKCIEMDPSSVKAWHRKAQALTRLGEWDDAIKSAQKGAELDPANKAFPEVIEKAELAKVKGAEEKARLKTDAADAPHAVLRSTVNRPKLPDIRDGMDRTYGYAGDEAKNMATDPCRYDMGCWRPLCPFRQWAQQSGQMGRYLGPPCESGGRGRGTRAPSTRRGEEAASSCGTFRCREGCGRGC